MLFYRLEIVLDEDATEEVVKEQETLAVKINRMLERMKYEKLPVSAYVKDIDNKKIVAVFSMHLEDRLEYVQKEILSKVENSLSVQGMVKNITEITVEEFRVCIADAHGKGYVRNYRTITNDLKIDFSGNRFFEVKETVLYGEALEKAKAIKKVNALMGGDAYRQEIERIYAEENEKQFYCHPVHYHITANSEEAAGEMTNLLLKALNNNGRLVGGRVSWVKELTPNCYNEQDFDNLICNSQGATVILSMNIEKVKSMDIANDYDEVIAYIGNLVKLYRENVLFIFQEVANRNSIGKRVLAEIEDTVRIIKIEEGIGNKKQAQEMLRQIILNSKYAKFLESTTVLELPEQDIYTLSEVYTYYQSWLKKMIYEKAYKSYGLKERVVVEEKTEENFAYKELKQMVGLKEIKDLVDRIVAMYKIQKKRQEMGLKMQNNALHMLFTGNPGSAKTTVARLMTRILYDEGVILNKKIVECGRGDLVGKYVGWTAKQVKAKFAEAREGILFIDEAYSLIDERNGSFGDEAINTIVQEMENHREDVIVIFAGYPEKMEKFLEKNEGLRSRIAFHLDFPNYNNEELIDILKLMTKKNGYECEDAVYEKCADIFDNVTEKKDYGNGRYVRNLLEHAIMKQSRRLMKDGGGIDEKQIRCLLAEDFEEMEQVKATEKISIGFRQS